MTQNPSHNSELDGRTDRSALVKPLVVRPRVARQMLGGMCEEALWRLINNGTLESFMQGRARLITTESIERHITQQIAAQRPIRANA